MDILLTENGAIALDFKATLSDPEAQVILPRLKSDLFSLLQKASQPEGIDVQDCKIRFFDFCSHCKTVSANNFSTGLQIEGIQQAEQTEGVKVFQCNTQMEKGIKLVASGPKVLSVTCLAPSPEKAKLRTEEGAALIKLLPENVNLIAN